MLHYCNNFKELIMKHLIILTLFVLTINIYGQQTELNVYTGELPPYSYTENNQLTGVAIDIVKELQKRVGFTHKIIKKPWGRVISESKNSNQMIFPLARRPYRENSYKWIGPILKDETIFIIKKSNYKKILHINELKDLNVGVSLGAPSTKRLQQLNFKNLRIISTETQLSKMFIRDRFDTWYASKLMIYNFLEKLNYDISDLAILYSDLKLDFYIATSLDVDNQVVQTWQKELNIMKEDGTYKRILSKYNLK